MSTTTLPRLAVKIDEAAEMIGVCRSTIITLIKRGDLHASKKLRHKLIPITEIERFLKA